MNEPEHPATNQVTSEDRIQRATRLERDQAQVLFVLNCVMTFLRGETPCLTITLKRDEKGDVHVRMTEDPQIALEIFTGEHRNRN